MTRALLLVLVVVAAPVLAQRAPERRPRVQEINIDDPDLIEGGVTSPDLHIVNQRGRAGHDSLIRVRTSFAEKVMASHADVP